MDERHLSEPDLVHGKHLNALEEVADAHYLSIVLPPV